MVCNLPSSRSRILIPEAALPVVHAALRAFVSDDLTHWVQSVLVASIEPLQPEPCWVKTHHGTSRMTGTFVCNICCVFCSAFIPFSARDISSVIWGSISSLRSALYFSTVFSSTNKNTWKVILSHKRLTADRAIPYSLIV